MPTIKARLALLIILTGLPLSSCQFLRIEEELPLDPPRTELKLLGWQHATAFDQRLQQTVAHIVEASPTISVTLDLVSNYDDELNSALESDFPPDIVMVESGRLVELVSAGMLQPIGDQVEAGDDFFPVLRNAFTVRGRYYCPPFSMNTLAVVYNSKMLEDAGIPPPADDWTGQDFASTVQKLTDPNKALIGLALGTDLSRWLPFLYAAGGNLTDSNETTMTINSTEAASGFHLLDDLWTDFYAMKPADMRTSWAGEALGKQRVAMVIEGDWIVSYLQQEFPEVQFGVVALPTGSQGKSTIAFSTCLAIPTQAKHPHEAIQFINQLISADAQRLIFSDETPIPSRISVANEWLQHYPALKPFVDGAAYAHPWRFFPGFDSLKSNIEGNLQRMYKAEIAVEDLLAAAQEEGMLAIQNDDKATR